METFFNFFLLILPLRKKNKTTKQTKKRIVKNTIDYRRNFPEYNFPSY